MLVLGVRQVLNQYGCYMTVKQGNKPRAIEEKAEVPIISRSEPGSP